MTTKWETGNWTSRRTDGGAFVERNSQGWWVYHCDEEGTILNDGTDEKGEIKWAPPAFPTPFESAAQAHTWADANIADRGGSDSRT